MKKQLKESSRKKRLIIAVSAVGVLVLIGGTIAYNGGASIFQNLFHLGGWGGEVFTEYFESPSNWACHEVTPKSVTYTNHNGANRMVRIKYDEYWKAAGSTSTDTTTELPLAQNGRRMTIINMQNMDKWVLQSDGYYYYTDVVADDATTLPFMDSVAFNCDVTEAEQYSCSEVNGVTTCESQENDYHNAQYHVRVTIEATETNNTDWQFNPSMPHRSLYSHIASNVNPAGTTVNFRNVSVVSDDPTTANGVGINRYEENGKEIYYYRGEVYDNHVIWGGFCWRILRTTATGGVKIVYNGTPSDVEVNGETVKQCSNSSQPSISYNGNVSYAYNTAANSPASFGYMYGDDTIVYQAYKPTYDEAYNRDTVFSRSVSYDGTSYTLNTDSGMFAKGRWNNIYSTANSNGYHYFCMTGEATCMPSDLYYSLDTEYYNYNSYILPIGNRGSLEGLKQAMFTNEHDSVAKTNVEGWFEANNLDGHVANTRNYEDDLEDAIYCNDRTFAQGAFAGEDKPYNSDGFGSAEYRIKSLFQPSLSCGKNDSFTKDDLVNGNGKLNHKIALMSADEYLLADPNSSKSFLYFSYYPSWTMSPYILYPSSVTHMMHTGSSMSQSNVPATMGLRPVVSLKAGIEYAEGGDGTAEKPFVIE